MNDFIDAANLSQTSIKGDRKMITTITNEISNKTCKENSHAELKY